MPDTQVANKCLSCSVDNCEEREAPFAGNTPKQEAPKKKAEHPAWKPAKALPGAMMLKLLAAVEATNHVTGKKVVMLMTGNPLPGRENDFVPMAIFTNDAAKLMDEYIPDFSTAKFLNLPKK